MAGSSGRVYVVIGHNDLEYLDLIKQRILQREGIVSAEVGRLPAVYAVAPQRGTMFSVRPPSLSPMCQHAVVVLCEDAVTVIGDILDAAGDLISSDPEIGTVFAVGEEVLDDLKAKQAAQKPSETGFPREVTLNPSCVVLEAESRGKEDVIADLCSLAEELGFLSDRGGFEEAILKREAVHSTGAGEGLAFPHAHTDSVKEAFLLVARSSRGIPFDAIDSRPVRLVLMLGYPAEKTAHLHALAWLSRRLLDSETRDAILGALTPEEVVSLLKGS